MDIKKLLTRSLSGIVYVGLIVGCILWGMPAVVVLASVFAILGIVEFAKLCNNNQLPNPAGMMLDIAGGIAIACGTYVYPLLAWVLILVLRCVFELYLKNENPIRNLALSIMSQIYIGVPLLCMTIIGALFIPTTLLAIFIFIWLNDTGAFIVGSTFGRNKMFERISPKKSWEGFFGGLGFNLIAAAVFCRFCSNYFGLESNYWIWLAMAALTTVFATWGDLVESLIKRTVHAKDSGTLIPGHGGILDRIDSLLLVAPALMLFLILVYMF